MPVFGYSGCCRGEHWLNVSREGIFGLFGSVFHHEGDSIPGGGLVSKGEMMFLVLK